MTMRYQPTGVDRDSYISGLRPGGKYGAAHDVNQRRDNLPDNVFSYIRDGVVREERARLNEEEARARTRLELASGKGGKRMINNTPAERQANAEALEAETEVQARNEALKELYARELAEWEDMLGQRGLATQRA